MSLAHEDYKQCPGHTDTSPLNSALRSFLLRGEPLVVAEQHGVISAKMTLVCQKARNLQQGAGPWISAPRQLAMKAQVTPDPLAPLTCPPS